MSTRPSRGSKMGRYGMIRKRPWWAKAKGSVSWGARWKTATRLLVVLVILWSLLINTTKVTHIRHHLRKKLALMEKAYTHLSFVDWQEFRKLISLLDLCIVPVFRLRLSRNLIPPKYEDVESGVIKELNNCPYVVLSFYLWMSFKNEEIFSISAYHCAELKKCTTTLACPVQRVYMQRTFLTLSLT